MRNRAAVVLLQDDSLCLIRRNRAGRTYYLFPGGGIEAGETPEQAAVREAYEELGLHVQLRRLVARFKFRSGIQYYYLATAVGGEFGTGTGPEMASPIDSVRGTYTPVWLPLEETLKVDSRPKELCQALARGDLRYRGVLTAGR